LNQDFGIFIFVYSTFTGGNVFDQKAGGTRNARERACVYFAAPLLKNSSKARAIILKANKYPSE